MEPTHVMLGARRGGTLQARHDGPPEDDPWVRLQRDLLDRAVRQGDTCKVAFYEYTLGLRPTLAMQHEQQRVALGRVQHTPQRAAVACAGRRSGDD